MTFRIRTLNSISQAGLSRLGADAFDVGPDVADPHAILVRSASLHGEPVPASLMAVARAGAGTNNIPVAEMSKRGIPVFNTPGSNANAVKELVVAGIFLAARNIVDAAAFAHRLEGDHETMDKLVEAGKKNYVGFELPGRTLGVIGLGAIGVEVANVAISLGMKVLGYDPAITVEHAWRLSSNVERVVSLDQLLRRSDIVTLHIPLVDGTRGLIGDTQFRRAWLRLFVGNVTVSPDEIRISGPTEALAQLAAAGSVEAPPVHSSQFHRKWRPVRDSNPCYQRERLVS